MAKTIKTQERRDRLDYLVMALALNGIVCDRFTSELIIENWELIQRKGGQFNIHDSVEIEWRLRKKYKPKVKVEAVPVNKK